MVNHVSALATSTGLDKQTSSHCVSWMRCDFTFAVSFTVLQFPVRKLVTKGKENIEALCLFSFLYVATWRDEKPLQNGFMLCWVATLFSYPRTNHITVKSAVHCFDRLVLVILTLRGERPKIIPAAFFIAAWIRQLLAVTRDPRPRGFDLLCFSQISSVVHNQTLAWSNQRKKL